MRLATLRTAVVLTVLRWADGVVAPALGEPVLIEDQEEFDAEITFEATP